MQRRVELGLNGWDRNVVFANSGETASYIADGLGGFVDFVAKDTRAPKRDDPPGP